MTVQERNTELLDRLHETGAGTAAVEIMGELWENNLPLVRSTVHRVTGLAIHDDSFEDMTQQAYFPFASAAQTYTEAEGVTFATYFTNRIKWGLCRYYDRNGYTVRIPQGMKKRIRDCMEKKRELETAAGHSVTYTAALEAMGLSPAAIKITLSTLQKLETVSLDAAYTHEDGEGNSLLNQIAAGNDIEADVLEQEWHRELHAVLMAAIRELPADAQSLLIRHYFHGVSFLHMADESGQARQTIYNRKEEAFRSIRAGKYGPVLAEFMPDMSAKEQAERIIRQARADVERLKLSDDERGLLAL